MKSHLIAIVAAMLVVGCGESQQSAPAPEAKPEPPTVKAPYIDIHDAARTGDIEVVKQHLAAGTKVDAKGGGDYTPLHVAAYRGHKELAELLITKGADMNVRNTYGETPLDLAILDKHTELADLLRKHGGKKGEDISIHQAAMYGNIKAVKQHLDAGADVNAKASRGWTPLHYAAFNDHKEIAELLIARGANVNAKDEDGETPLDNAKYKPETADLLRKHGGKKGEVFKAEGK